VVGLSGVQLSIIIPVLNEAALIADALREVPRGAWEVVVVDAGSRDGTAEIARSICQNEGWVFVPATLDRPSVGRTVAAAVPYTGGKTLLVLPCDCRMSADSLSEISGACGGFAKKYFPDHWTLRAYAKLQNTFRSRWRRHLVWTNGIFFPRGTEVPTTGFLEDVLLSDALRKDKSWQWIETPILVSSRRYHPHRVFSRIALNFLVLFFFRLGMRDFARLKRLYLWLN